MNQGMPMWPNKPNMGGWQNFNNMNQRLNSLENEVTRLERQMRRLENRVNRIESAISSPRDFNGQSTGYGNSNDKYMM